MTDVIMLDLHEVADEWQERIDEMSANVPNAEGMSWGEIAEATEAFLAEPEQLEFVAQYRELCEGLGLSPVEPDTLRHFDRLGVETPLIREDTFEDYAREFAGDIYGDGVRELGWCIDWGRFARSLKQDYIDIDYDGHTWLRRA